MKKIFLILFVLFSWFISDAQYPVTQYLGSDSSLVTARGALKSRLITYTYADTTAANLERIRQYAGAIIYTSGTNSMWYRNSTATAWVEFTSSGSSTVNIYNSDGTLSGNRKLEFGSYTLSFTRGGVDQSLLFTADSNFFKDPSSTNGIILYPDSIVIKGVDEIADTTGYNVLILDRITGLTKSIPSTSIGGGGSTPTLQQVLTAGSILTQTNKIYNDSILYMDGRIDDVDTARFSFYGQLGSAKFGVSYPDTLDEEGYPISIGEYSFSSGKYLTTSGLNSFSTGQYNFSTGTNSFSGGGNNISSGVSSFAFGQSNEASGFISTAIGESSTATDDVSMAFGYLNNATAPSATAFGVRMTVSGAYSFGINLSGIAQTFSTDSSFFLNAQKIFLKDASLAGASNGDVLTLVNNATGEVEWAASSGTTYTFTNGLTESSGTVKLGGTLTENTTITYSGKYTLAYDSVWRFFMYASQINKSDSMVFIQSGTGTPIMRISASQKKVFVNEFQSQSTAYMGGLSYTYFDANGVLRFTNSAVYTSFQGGSYQESYQQTTVFSSNYLNVPSGNVGWRFNNTTNGVPSTSDTTNYANLDVGFTSPVSSAYRSLFKVTSTGVRLANHPSTAQAYVLMADASGNVNIVDTTALFGGGGGVTDHGALTGLTDDDHTQYTLLAGRSGGQTIKGGTGTTDDLVLQSTSGVGASGAEIQFKVGNNGATSAGLINNSGEWLLGGISDQGTYTLQVSGAQFIQTSGVITSFRLDNTSQQYAEASFSMSGTNRFSFGFGGTSSSSPFTSNAYFVLQSGANNFVWINSSTLLATLSNSGKLFVGGNTTPTAYLHAGASTTSTASLRIPTGTAPTSPNDGDMWNDGTDLKYYAGSNTRTVANLAAAQTFTNKRYVPLTSFTTSASSLTPDFTAYRVYGYTALAANLTINAPTGSPSNGETWEIYIKDDGTSRTLSWNAAYVAAGITLPASTTTGKGMIIGGTLYNSVYYSTYLSIEN